jgi:hypothetical protein
VRCAIHLPYLVSRTFAKLPLPINLFMLYE